MIYCTDYYMTSRPIICYSVVVKPGSLVPTHYPPMRPSPYPLPTHLPMGMGGYWVPIAGLCCALHV